MKKRIPNIFIAIIILVTLVTAAFPHVAQAFSIGNAFANFATNFISVTGSALVSFFFNTGGIALFVSSKILALSGTLLNGALYETMHISNLVKNVDAIGLTWRTVRDFSSIFFIFLLLYGSISTILGLNAVGLSPRRLVLNIVLCGLLMNFSLFFTKVIVDASNVVTLGFYNAIAPDRTEADGGISNIMMQQLRVVTQWDPRGAAEAVKSDFEKKAGPALWLGSTVLVIAAISFFVASLMLLLRIAILILLMAFSPIYFISLVLPNTSGLASKWRSMLVGQALFAPAYLAVIYVVMKIVSDPAFLDFVTRGDKNPTFSQAFIDGGSTGVIMNFIIVIVLLNMALVVAKQFGGYASTYAEKGIKLLQRGPGKLITGAASGAAGGITGFAGRHTMGRLGTYLDDKLSETHTGNSLLGRTLRSYTTGAAAKGTYGSKTSFKDSKKSKLEREAKGAEIDAWKAMQTHVALGNYSEIRKSLKKLNNKAAADKGADELADPLVAAHLTQGQLDEIMKSTEFTQVEKNKISTARKDGLMTLLTTDPTADQLFKDRKQEEILKFPPELLKKSAVSIRLDANMLAKIARDGILEDKDREEVRQHFEDEFARLATPGSTASIPPSFQKAHNWLTTGPGAELF